MNKVFHEVRPPWDVKPSYRLGCQAELPLGMSSRATAWDVKPSYYCYEQGVSRNIKSLNRKRRDKLVQVRTAACPSVRPSVRPSARPSIRPSVRPSVCPSFRPSVRPSVRLFVRPSVRPFARPSVRPSVCPSVRPSARPSVRPSVRPPVRPSVRPPVRSSVRSSVRSPARPSVRPFVRPSVHPFDGKCQQKRPAYKLSYSKMQYAKIQPIIVLRGRHFVRHLTICYPICVKLLQLNCGLTMHNSINKTKSLY